MKWVVGIYDGVILMYNGSGFWAQGLGMKGMETAV